MAEQYDDIVIGSGLAALGVVMGLPAGRRILVLGGPGSGRRFHYDAQGAAPCAYLGAGGLGNDWHGVIPMSTAGVAAPDGALLAELLALFYPRAKPALHVGTDQLFVPWRPIRPRSALAALAAQRPGLHIVEELATGFRADASLSRVITSTGIHAAKHLWIAAGALHTPGLLDHSLGQRISRGTVDDHALCYIGHVDDVAPPRIHHVRDGMYIPGHHDSTHTALYTLRPARFSFRRLDHGIEQRAAFGLPTGNAIAKIFRAMSAGLVTEAVYNRFGLLAKANRYSIYAQTRITGAYELTEGAGGSVALRARSSAIRAGTDAARAASPFPAARHSERPDLFIPGIHLHNSVDVVALQAAGINVPGAPVQVVDASVMLDIGPLHHSFRMLLGAWDLARHTA